MLALFGAKLTPNRQKCCLLSWRVLQQAIYSPMGSIDVDAPPGDLPGPPRTLGQAEAEDAAADAARRGNAP